MIDTSSITIEVIIVVSIINIYASEIQCLPLIDQSEVLVITGIPTCGQNKGFCLLGNDCLANSDLIPDGKGHCDGLKTNFSPNVYFSCCRHVNDLTNIDVKEFLPTVSSKYFDSSEKIELEPPCSINFDSSSLNHAPNQSVENSTDFNSHHTIESERRIDHVLDSESMTLLPSTSEKPEENVFAYFTVPKSTSNTLFAPNSVNLTTEIIDNEGSQENQDDLRTTPASLEASVGPGKCYSVTNSTDLIDSCVNIWKFTFKDEILCLGALLNSVWILTSASCISNIFEANLNSVVVSNMNKSDDFYGISNIIVHENFGISGRMDVNDIGLVSLNRLTNDSCYFCLPNRDTKYTDKWCSTYTTSLAHLRNQSNLNTCHDRLKILAINSKMYLSLSCTSEEQNATLMKRDSGNILWCGDALVGVETSNDQGLHVFSPITDFTDWIIRNIQLYL